MANAQAENARLSAARRLSRRPSDAYAVRWESKTTGKSGYAPACGNEWRLGVCEAAYQVWRLSQPIGDPQLERVVWHVIMNGR